MDEDTDQRSKYIFLSFYSELKDPKYFKRFKNFKQSPQLNPNRRLNTWTLNK